MKGRLVVGAMLLLGPFACDRAGDASTPAVGEANAVASAGRAALVGCSGVRGGSGARQAMLFYSDIDTTTDHLVGLVFEFQLVGDSLRGIYSEGQGELGSPRPLRADADLRSTDSISLVLANGDDSSLFRGRISCDSLWGEFRADASSQWAKVQYRRVEDGLRR